MAVLVSLVNNSTEEISDDADFTMTVAGTDGQTYTADFGTVSQCSGFYDSSGFFDLAPGDSTVGLRRLRITHGGQCAVGFVFARPGISRHRGVVVLAVASGIKAET